MRVAKGILYIIVAGLMFGPLVGRMLVGLTKLFFVSPPIFATVTYIACGVVIAVAIGVLYFREPEMFNISSRR